MIFGIERLIFEKGNIMRNKVFAERQTITPIDFLSERITEKDTFKGTRVQFTLTRGKIMDKGFAPKHT